MQKRIDLTTPTFRTKPTVRFAETMGVDDGFWADMWNRYSKLGYSKADLVEWFEYKTRKTINERTVRRWIVRQELYDDARMAVRRGAKEVSIEYFEVHGNRNLEEIDLVDREDYLEL